MQSKPGHGSRFEAWLPAAAADSTAGAGPAMLPLGRGETVLVVESERERLLYDEEMLAALGYEPVGFERPADAIAACRSAPDRFDIILVSHASQTPGGVDLAHALHEIAPRQPLLLATGVHERCQRRRAGGSRNFRTPAPAPGQHRAGRGAGALSAFPRHQAITALTKSSAQEAKIQHSSESVAIVRWLRPSAGSMIDSAKLAIGLGKGTRRRHELRRPSR